MSAAALALGCSARCLFGQASLPADLKRKVQDDLAMLPNYICTATIEQSRFRNGGCARSDCRAAEMSRFRLDTGLVEGSQIFGWPGGEKLSDADISRLVPGQVTDGDIVVLARLLLLSSPALIGEQHEDYDGRPIIRYHYRVSLDNSGWVFRRGAEQLRVAYQGSLRVDTNSFDAVELKMAAESIPPELSVKAIDRTLGYKRTAIGSRDFLLPHRAVLTTVDLNDNTTKTETRFDHCRQYVARSHLYFPVEGLLPASKSARTKDRSVLLPDAFIVEVNLETGIDSETAGVGDVITARLRRDMSRRRIFPIGNNSLLHGRISRMELSEGDYYMDLLFTHLEVNGTKVDIRSRRNQLIVKSKSGWIPAPISGSGRIQLLPGQVLFFRSTL